MASEEDLRVVKEIYAELHALHTDSHEMDYGPYCMDCERVEDEFIVTRFATAITAARAETWKEAIAIVKYADAQANWPLKEGSLIKALEAAAGSKTKVFSEDEQKNQGR